MTNSSLRKQLLTTIIVLMLFVSSTIIWVSIQAGTDAVNHMTQRVMLNMIERIGNDNENQLNEAIRVIETIAPNSSDLPQKQNFPTDLATLEQRLWFASNLYQQTTDFVYFAGPDGRFIGLHRAASGQTDLFLRNAEESQRVQYTVQKPGDRGRPTGTSNYDARSRPWYIEATGHDGPVWSDIYSSYTDHQPAITLAKAIYQPDHRLAGVVATDILLKKLSDHLRLLHISDHSIAYIVDAKGYIVASSASDYPDYALASTMADPLIRLSYLNAVKGQIDAPGTNPASTKTCLLDDEKVDVAYARLGNKFGLQWTSVVAVPRSDFMAGINHSVLQSIAIVVVFIIVALLVGLKAIEHMLRDIRQLTSAALKLGNGEPLPRLHIHRKDEIGNLVQTFIEMENKLRFDRLTQVNNRDFLMAQIDFLQRRAARNPAEKVNFTLLFLDLDKFKAINDGYGHAAGDQLLIVIAARLKAAVRDTDTVARYGGDEFVVLLNGTSTSIDIQTTVAKIHSLVEKPIALSEHIVSVRVSVGWAIFPTEGLTYTKLIEIADARMFCSKKENNDVCLRLVDNKN